MAKVRDFLTESLEELGIAAAGETPTANDMDFAFRRLNRLLDKNKIGRLVTPYPQLRFTWNFGAVPVAAYTVGTGGTIATPRPGWVDAVKFYDTAITPVTEFDLGRGLTDEEYRDISMKALTSTYPASWYYDPTFGSTGRGTLYFYPVPTTTTLVGVLYAPSPLPEFADINDTISVPPGYHDWLVYEVAMRLAPGFRREPSATLVKLHAEAKHAVEAANLRMSDLSFPAQVTGGHGAGWSALIGP